MRTSIAGSRNKPALPMTRMLVVTTGIRRTELYAMLCSVLSNVSQLQVKVIFHSEEGVNFDVRLIKHIAEINGNLLSFGTADTSKSVAAIVAEEILDVRSGSNVRRIISADDDHIFDERCFAAYAKLAASQDRDKLQNCVLSPCVVDVADAYGYADWQAAPRQFHSGAFEAFVRQFGLASAAHQNWACGQEQVTVKSGYINNCWMAPVCMFSDSILDNMLQWKKGVKGKDLMIQQEMLKDGALFLLSLHARVLHTGVKSGECNAHWKEYSDVFKDHAMTKRVSAGDTVEFYDIE